MLPDTLLSRAKALCRSEHDLNTSALQLELAQIDSTLNAQGRFVSGARIHEHRLRIRDRFRLDADAAWNAIARALEASHAHIEDADREPLKRIAGTLISDAKGLATGRMRTTLGHPAFSGMQSIQQSGLDSFIDEERTHVARISALADLLVDDHAGRPKGNSPQPNLTIHAQNIGAIQTGAGAQSTVIQGGMLGATEILGALHEVQAALDHLEDQETKSEMLEIVAEASEIVSRPSPNRSKLKALLDILSTTVQAIAAAPGAYTALQVAMQAAGF